MKVTLLNKPDERIAIEAARTCRNNRGGNGKVLLKHVIMRKHESILEHVVFTFKVEGISRVTSHQLVRHRIASYAQESQRAVDQERAGVVIPPSIKGKERERYREVVRLVKAAYGYLVKAGVPLEDARYILPQAAATSIVITMNGRALRNFLGLRLCKKAQWEIREMAEKMLELAREAAPITMSGVGPRCSQYGRCLEGRKELCEVGRGCAEGGAGGASL